MLIVQLLLLGLFDWYWRDLLHVFLCCYHFFFLTHYGGGFLYVKCLYPPRFLHSVFFFFFLTKYLLIKYMFIIKRNFAYLLYLRSCIVLQKSEQVITFIPVVFKILTSTNIKIKNMFNSCRQFAPLLTPVSRFA